MFLRYLSCSRESCGAVVEQVSSLWEPFLKKLSFLFAMHNAKGDPVWPFGLDGLVAGLRLSSKDLRETDKAYWQTQSVEDAVLRLAYQLRHKGAHEAHDNPYYEHERNAYFVFAAVVVSCKILIEAFVEIGKLVDEREDVDEVRDLFVRIEELSIGPDGPRLSSSTGVSPSRLQKLLGFSNRAQAVWPNCSAELRRLLESEYLSVRNELSEADREANIQEFIDAQQEDRY